MPIIALLTAAALALQAPAAPEEAAALLARGDRLRLDGAYASALDAYLRAHGLAARGGDGAAAARALVAAAQVDRAQGRHADAHQRLKQALDAAVAAGDAGAAASAHAGIAGVQAQQGQYDAALEEYGRGQAAAEAAGDKAAMALVLQGLGGLQSTRGDFDAALEHLQRALALQEELSDAAGAGLSHDLLGFTFRGLGDYDLSLEHYQRSLSLRESASDRPGRAMTLGSLGAVYYLRGDYARAFDHYEKSLALRTALGERPGVALMLHNMALLHISQGNREQARAHIDRALALSREIGEQRVLAGALSLLGSVLVDEGRTAEALAAYRESLALREAMGDKTRIAESLRGVAGILRDAGDLPAARAAAARALDLAQAAGARREHAWALHLSGRIALDQGNTGEALAFAQRALDADAVLQDPSLRWRALVLEGRAHSAAAREPQARAALEAAIATIEGWRYQVAGGERERQRFLEGKLEPYLVLVDLLQAAGRKEEAFAVAERAKARVLLDVLQSGHARVTRVLTPAERDEEKRARARLVTLGDQVRRERVRPAPDEHRLGALTARLEDARREHETLQIRLYTAHPELRAQRGEAPPVGLDEAAALVTDDRTALLEYLVGESAVHLFVLAREGGRPVLGSYTMPIRGRDLAARTEAFRERLATRHLGFGEEARGLYELLLRPAQAQLQGRTRLVVVPDGPLWQLPFQALMPAPGRYLLEEAALSYAPSLTVLREMQKPRPGAGARAGLLAFANPVVGPAAAARAEVLMGERLEPLPESERQARELQRLYGAEGRVYVGPRAREDRVKAEAGEFRILHFATHGILNDASPLYSQLVLSGGGEGEDGLLEAREILDLDLTADLAVLSACETARGRVAPGEGVIGLSWATFVAGCPSTVVSQWKVESRSTTELMLAFHRGLRGGRSKAEALRDAALSVLRRPRWRHPFYWAPFVLMGAGG